MSTIAYFVIGYTVAYGVSFYSSAAAISGGAPGFQGQGYTLVRFFFLCTFAAAVPAIVSGGIAERAKFTPQAVATATLVAVCYPLLEGVYWNKNFGLQEYFFKDVLGAEFKDFAGSVVVHAFGGWVALGAVLCLGPRLGRYDEGEWPRRRPRFPGWQWGPGYCALGGSDLRDERAEARGGVGPRRHQLADGHVRGHRSCADRRRQRSRLRAQRRARWIGRGVRRLRRNASPWRARSRRRRWCHLCADVPDLDQQVEARRRPGRVGTARIMWSMGRHRVRHLWAGGAGRPRRE